LIGTFQYFTQAYTITNGRGDPNNATLFVNLVLFREGFVFNHMGYAAAIAWLLFVIVLGLTLVLFAVSRQRVYYAGGERWAPSPSAPTTPLRPARSAIAARSRGATGGISPRPRSR